MIKSTVSLQDLRRRIYIKAKAEPDYYDEKQWRSVVCRVGRKIPVEMLCPYDNILRWILVGRISLQPVLKRII